MKTIKKMLLPLVGILLLLASCQEQKKENQEMSTEEVEQIVYDAPKQIISLEEADSLFVNYKDRRAASIAQMEAKYQEGGKPFEPTQFVTFDIEVLKNYIGYVEQEAKNGGAKADSLRIYLGNYGITKTSQDRHNTVFILPTAKTDGGTGGIYIDNDGKAKLIRDYWKNNPEENVQQKSKASFAPNFSPNMIYNNQSLILNFGHCCNSKNHDF